MTNVMPASPIGQQSWKQRLRHAAQLSGAMPRAALSRMLASSGRSPRFTGIYRNRPEAVAAAARFGRSGYDDEKVAEISFDVMCRRAAWDYPIIFWLNRLLPGSGSVLDAGGHMGTKFIAFSELIDLRGVGWTVYDLPGIIRTARLHQRQGRVPSSIRFEDRLEPLPEADIFLGSGLLQYLDTPFPELIAKLPRPPPYILLNKVALRDGAGLFTLERVGQVRVPYQIRNQRLWLAEIEALGYEVMDSWQIPELGHVVPTHPWCGRSRSCGYALRHKDAGAPAAA